MQTNDNDTIVDKAVNFVKDAFGIRHGPASGVDPNFEDGKTFGDHDTEAEVTAEQASSLDPNAFVVSPSGQVAPVGLVDPPRETDAERLRREVDEQPRPKSLLERNDELVRRDNAV